MEVTALLTRLGHDILTIDLAAFWFVNSHHTPLLDPVFLAITQLGNGWVAIPVVLALVCWTHRRRAAFPVAICGLAFALAGLSNNTLKRFIEWRRPVEYFVRKDPTGELARRVHVVGEELGGRTFPSGHTNTAFASAVLLVGLLGRRFWPALFVAASVGWSRLYLGVHFPSDVITGAVLGSGFAWAVMAVMRKLRRPRPASAEQG